MTVGDELPGRSLGEIIAAQVACTTQLVDVLESERSALIGNDLDALELACSAKAMAAQHLQQLGERFLVATGHLVDRDAIEALLARQPGGQRLLARWAELGQLAKVCSEGNRANGALLEVREKQVRGALAAMQPDVPAVYGRSGNHRPALPSQLISRA